MPNFNQTWPNFKSTGRSDNIILRILKDRRVRGIYQRIVGEPSSTRATTASETSTASENRIRRKISPAIFGRGQFSNNAWQLSYTSKDIFVPYEEALE